MVRFMQCCSFLATLASSAAAQVVYDDLPENMQPLAPNAPQPESIEEPDRRTPCEVACDAAVESCYQACWEQAQSVGEAEFRAVLVACQRPCAGAQESCRVDCNPSP